MLFLFFISMYLQSRISVYVTHAPAGTSVQNMIHWAQVGVPEVRLGFVSNQC